MKKSIYTTKDAMWWNVINLEIGKKIEHWIWANDETGEYEVYCTDKNGKYILANKEYGSYENVKIERLKGKIKFVDTRIKKEIK